MTRKLLRSSVFVALAVGMAMSVRAHAQATQHFGSQAVVITGTGTQSFTAMASDASGNLYISDENSSLVYKETLSGGTYTQSIVAVDGYTTSGGVKNPLGVAVDSNGNVYISDLTNDRLLKETPAGGGTYTQSVVMQNSGGNFVNPNALAIDSSGDVFIVAQSYNIATSSYVYHVFEFTPGSGGTYTQSTLSFAGLEDPSGLAIDSSNNLYIDDSGYPRVVKETLSGGTYTQSVVVDDSVFNWLDQSGYIAVDKNGDVFVVNGGPFGYDAETVVEAVPIGGSYHFRLIGGGFGYWNERQVYSDGRDDRQQWQLVRLGHAYQRHLPGPGDLDADDEPGIGQRRKHQRGVYHAVYFQHGDHLSPRPGPRPRRARPESSWIPAQARAIPTAPPCCIPPAQVARSKSPSRRSTRGYARERSRSSIQRES